MRRQIKIAIYMRLSKEDEFLKNESNSIRMQKILLKEYVKVHFEDYQLLEFWDDGYSGTNFNRPGIFALLQLVKESSVDCIIVKDLSRFSRDYIELGTYINQIFPFMGIRFISVNDGYDSADGSHEAGDIDIAFKNLLYDLYSKDLSVKVKASLAARKDRGEYVCGNSPFGYEKAPNDRHMLLIEEKEAAIVRRIYQFALEGKTSVEIARIFNEEGVKTPIQFKIEKGKTCRKPKGGRFIWSASTICQMLRNEVYAGDIVYGKYDKDGVGGRNRIKPRGEWKTFYNHHEPIIQREVFDRVQQERGYKKMKESKVKHPLQGKLVCGCCRRNLRIRTGLNPYFACPNLYVYPQKSCVHKINAMFLEQYVLFEMLNRIQELADMRRLQEKRRAGMQQELKLWETEKQDIQAQLILLQQKKIHDYETFTMEKNTSEENLAVYRKEGIGQKEKEKKLQSSLKKAESSMEDIIEQLGKEQNTSELLAYFGLTELTGTAVQKLIQNIVVYDEGNIEICWNEICNSLI